MAEVNALLVDLRDVPREVEEIALGVIRLRIRGCDSANPPYTIRTSPFDGERPHVTRSAIPRARPDAHLHD